MNDFASNSLLFNTSQAAREIAYALRGTWDGCNGVVLSDKVDEAAFTEALAIVALDLPESIEYCSENDRCHNELKFIAPPPDAKSHLLQWYRWQRKTLLEDIQDPSKYSLIFLDETLSLFSPTCTSVDESMKRLVELMYYQRQWRQVLMRKSIFKSIKSNPHLNLEIGANGPQLKSSLVPFSQKRSEISTNNQSLKRKIPDLASFRKPGCRFVISTQDPTALFAKE